ncbi:putative mitochondrial hypothetical protein [Leptomonas pyrrhocoris]|uniref:RNA-editing substrate-binding complex 5 protein domain-containing protein n=1 Tax=Leptomonas pyrrhocoris TaxID=157538 RepID=A0A0N0VDL4_LEPPY|nr:putative mitochondrial hypothetical protein [Leptomonas pyrrhocoris]KPA75971.1 putative mitochondrial hypothetical protein [Leptomonas pyrrhocoris]|eukprot:XP_015654410.1 putative mitochondrial hypothetical protein [Leptomonas pyrrhocoris]
MFAAITVGKTIGVRRAQRLAVARCAASSITSTLSLARSPSVRTGYLSALCVATRRYTNVLYRLPPTQTIPTHSPSGEEVDTELFVRQVKNFFDVLRQTQLIEMVYEMKSCPYYECLFTNDIFFQHFEMLLLMPKFGRENRSAEMSETIRYMRGWGATADVNHVLQDTKGGRASGSDFISTTHGILMGYGTPRTNKLAMMTLTGETAESDARKENIRALSVEPVELLPDSPPLSDLLAFSGQRTFVFADSDYGHHAVNQAVQRLPKVLWQTIKLEPQCSFFSHMAGANYVYDVLCDQDFPVSLERLGESGLNPFPVEWSEPRKLGITMRSICMTARFVRGTMNGGGFANSSTHQAASFTYNSRNVSKNSRLFAGGHRKHGDQLSPLAAQLEAGEIQKPVYQPVPRYAAPLHCRGSVVPANESFRRQ